MLRAGGGSRLPAALAALGERNYRLFFFGQLISLTGAWIQLVAQSWLVYRLTGSPALLGAVTFAGQFPGFLLSPLGGLFADRFNRRHILIATQTASLLLAFALAALTLTGGIEGWHVFALASLLGVVNAFDLPARQAFVADVVGGENLLRALTLSSAAVNVARLAGPALAGLLVATVGEGWCFFANGVSFTAVIAGLLMMRVGATARPAAGRPTFTDLFAGFRFVLLTGPVRALLLLFGLITLAGLPYTVLMPVFADRVLAGGSGGYGALMASAGAGALAGAFFLMTRPELRRLATWMALSAAGFGASLMLFAGAGTFRLAALLLVPTGFLMVLCLTVSNMLVHALAPEELRGRVLSAYSMAFLGASPLGALLTGFLAGWLGAPTTVALGGGCCVLAAALFALRLPALREEARRVLPAANLVGAAETAG